MKLLSFEEEELRKAGGQHTAREIRQQPEVWRKIYGQTEVESEAIKRFLEEAVRESDEVILTGAGTSAFIGMNLEHEYWRSTGLCSRAIPTTDLITHPQRYFHGKKRVLLVSFARSGNSPESMAAVEMAERFSQKVFHLIITCNRDGELYKYPGLANRYVFLLPEETNDRSLAMTSSYSGMLLSALLISRIANLQGEEEKVIRAGSYAEKIFRDHLEEIRRIASLEFDRVVILASGAQAGTARESQLKIQELTDGHVMGMSDSYLGFRHGPKAVINPATLVIYLFSNDPYVLQYEYDLVRGMRKGKPPRFRLGVAETSRIAGQVKEDLDLGLAFSEGDPLLDEEFLALCNVVPAQLIGFYKSLSLGLQPDAPSVSGAISRVVEGVVIYPAGEKKQ